MASGTKGVITKARLDALTDGIFAFAMTLLVLNLEFPDDLEITSASQMLDAFGDHADDLLLYVITFFVLGRRWFGQARIRPEPEEASDRYARWVLIHLFFITLMPFSTQIVGRYEFPPSIWLYAANITLGALAAIRLTYLAEVESGRSDPDNGRLELTLLIASAVLSIVVSFLDADLAMLAYLLNVAAPIVHRWVR